MMKEDFIAAMMKYEKLAHGMPVTIRVSIIYRWLSEIGDFNDYSPESLEEIESRLTRMCEFISKRHEGRAECERFIYYGLIKYTENLFKRWIEYSDHHIRVANEVIRDYGEDAGQEYWFLAWSPREILECKDLRQALIENEQLFLRVTEEYRLKLEYEVVCYSPFLSFD
jgi:hypothetical protein